MMKVLPRDPFFIFWTATVGLFCWPLLLGQKGYYYGDFQQQMYPWALYLRDCLHNGTLPVWTELIGCGFPLLAEGQIGAFYPIHWLFLGLLPMPFGYNLSFVALFFLSGIFTYLFCRQAGLSAPGAAFASVTSTFGSAYAGLFYGAPALRTLTFFPLSLYWILRLRATCSWKPVIWLALSWAVAFFGGSAQMAFYAVFAGLFYYAIISLGTGERRRFQTLPLMAAALILFLGLVMCQLLPSLELISYSARAETSADFALQKSFNPLNLLTLAWPGFGVFLGFDFYMGILPFILCFWAVIHIKKDKRVLLPTVLAIFFIFLALGRFNPAYTIFVKTFHLYSFRAPSKFLFFASFFMAVLAGIGLDRVVDAPHESLIALRRFAGRFLQFFLFIFIIAHFTSRIFYKQILEFFKQYVKDNVYGRPGHPYELEYYWDRLAGYVDHLVQRTAWNDQYFLSALLLWVIVVLLFHARVGVERTVRRRVFIGIFMILIFDLYAYSFVGTGFRGNQVNVSQVQADAIAVFLQRTKGDFRTYEATFDSLENLPRWRPNANMLFGYSSVGIYTPLALRGYSQHLKSLGAVDDSSSVPVTTRAKFEKNRHLLDLLNVRFILTRHRLDSLSGLSLAEQNDFGDRLYENANYLPRAFLVEGTSEPIAGTIHFALESSPKLKAIKLERLSHDVSELEFETERPAFIFLSEVFYPGWRASLNGKETPILLANNVFRAVQVPVGKNHLQFFYKPLSLRCGLVLSALTFLLCLFLLFMKQPQRVSQ